jgi:NADPH:quinone reductase-like Zn-dependent oxidoreductase
MITITTATGRYGRSGSGLPWLFGRSGTPLEGVAATLKTNGLPMKRIQYRKYGGPETMQLEELELATPRKGFDVVYDTAGKMTTVAGLGMLRKDGVFLDIDPTPAKFLRSFVTPKLKPIVRKPRRHILDDLARAAGEGKLRLPVAEIVPLGEAIRLVTALEAGRKLGGKGLVVMD